MSIPSLFPFLLSLLLIFFCFVDVAMTAKAKRLGNDFPAPLIIEPTAPHTATVIWLHGLGDSGQGWSFLAEKMQMPWIRWIFPTASQRAVAINGGAKSNAWFDIQSRDNFLLSPDEVGYKSSRDMVMELIRNEMSPSAALSSSSSSAAAATGAAAGIPAHRIVVGGFSQGGALSAYTGLTFDGFGWFTGMEKYLLKESEQRTVEQHALLQLELRRLAAVVVVSAFIPTGLPGLPHPEERFGDNTNQGKTTTKTTAAAVTTAEILVDEETTAAKDDALAFISVTKKGGEGSPLATMEKKTPYYVLHGGDDGLVHVDYSKNSINTLKVCHNFDLICSY